MKSSNQNNNNQTLCEVQFIYGKKIVKNKYHYALKLLGQPISQISWQSLSNFKNQSNYLIRRFEITIAYLFYNQKISPSQNGIRVHIKRRFCQVYIPNINYFKDKQIQNQKWELQNISNQIFQSQYIRTQPIKDLTLHIQDSKLESKDIVVQFTHLTPVLGEQYYKQKIISTQSFTNFHQIIQKDTKIDRDILMSLEKAQQMKLNEKQITQQIEFQNEQIKQGEQIINAIQTFNLINKKLSKQNTKKTHSNQKNNSFIRQQQQKMKRKSELYKRIINKKYLNKSIDLQIKRESDQIYDEVLSIENDSESIKIELQSLQEDPDKKHDIDSNIQKQMNQNLQRDSSLNLEQSQINDKNQFQKNENCRAVKTTNFISVQNLNNQTLIQSIVHKKDIDFNIDENKNQINTIKLDDCLSSENFNNYKRENNTSNIKIIIKKNNSYLQNNIIKNQLNPTNNCLQGEKKTEMEDLQEQIQNEKKKENENQIEILFKEQQQQTQIVTNQQIEKEIQKHHFDRMIQNKPSRCSVIIIPRIKDAQIQVYFIENNESEWIQYDQELNKVILPKMIIVKIKSHQLINEDLFFQCLYQNGKEYFLTYDELQSFNPQQLLDYMIQNSMLI